MKSTSFLKVLLLVFIVTCLPSLGQAAVIQMDQGELYSTAYDYGGMGTGRAVGISVEESFHMSKLGMDLGVTTATALPLYDFEIFSSVDGHSIGTLLDRIEVNLASGEGWQDFDFDFDFLAGNFYVINFARVDNLHFGDLGTMYSWEPSAFVDYGLLSVVEGLEGATPSAGNSIVAHMRITNGAAGPVATPEPSSMILLGAGLLGLFGFARKRVNRA